MGFSLSNYVRRRNKMYIISITCGLDGLKVGREWLNYG
jgi:hypothetical protein